ncbi:hypothetical protein FZEAL_4155 [Fusarium zealandicum]|uniref:Uncharacterized protein n=1 Tax=Fusarium zealandicum TaxID=1053134 RepID=A0A8H4UM97_9HYPO|nr:hypothetical protein FZEAL_4155 [Fusarium zealandicum]
MSMASNRITSENTTCFSSPVALYEMGVRISTRKYSEAAQMHSSRGCSTPRERRDWQLCQPPRPRWQDITLGLLPDEWLAGIASSNAATHSPRSGGKGQMSEHAIGLQLEAHLQNEYRNVTCANFGTLEAVFVHCEGSYCHVDEFTGSRENRAQVTVALDFITRFVARTEADPAQVVIVTPDKANVALINSLRKQPRLALISAMQPAKTVHGFQGRESSQGACP